MKIDWCHSCMNDSRKNQVWCFQGLELNESEKNLDLLEVLWFHSDITAAVRDVLDQVGGQKTGINIRISASVLLDVYTQSLQSF